MHSAGLSGDEHTITERWASACKAGIQGYHRDYASVHAMSVGPGNESLSAADVWTFRHHIERQAEVFKKVNSTLPLHVSENAADMPQNSGLAI